MGILRNFLRTKQSGYAALESCLTRRSNGRTPFVHDLTLHSRDVHWEGESTCPRAPSIEKGTAAKLQRSFLCGSWPGSDRFATCCIDAFLFAWIPDHGLPDLTKLIQSIRKNIQSYPIYSKESSPNQLDHTTNWVQAEIIFDLKFKKSNKNIKITLKI